MSEILFELERAFDGDDLAALFGEFAAAFEERRPASVEGEGTRLEIDPPPRTTVELEIEREDEADETDDEVEREDEADESDGDGDDLPRTIELEIELEWDEATEGPGSVRVVDLVDEKGQKAAADESQTTLSEPTGGDDGEGADGEAEDLEMGDAGDTEEGEPRTPSDGDGAEAGGGRRSRFEVYRDRADEWRWRLVHWNGNVVADGGEGYASRHNAERAARAVMRSAPDARVERID